MDGSRFDAWTRSAASASSRRALLASAIGGLAAMIAGPGAEAAKKRIPGEICRKHGDCTTNECGPKDARGRRRCLCHTPADCPQSKAGDYCHVATCESGVCGIAPRDTSGLACDPDGSDCCGGQVCGGIAVGATTCRTNHAPSACDVYVRHPWRASCIPVTLIGGDPDRDLSFFYITEYPRYGFVREFVASATPNVAVRTPAGGGVRALPDGGICAVWSNGFDFLANGDCAAPAGYPHDDSLAYGNILTYICPDASYSALVMCYLPQAPTFTGSDTFTYVTVDEWGVVSEPATVEIEVFEV